MCNCKHSTMIGEAQHGEKCEIDPSVSVGEGWQSGLEEESSVPDEMYRTARSNATGYSGMRTPRGRGIPVVTPDAPLRQRIARDPELAAGVAIVQRRIDYDEPTFAEPSGYCPIRPPDESRRSRRQTSRPCPPRMTKMTPCGKCLRM